MAMWAWVTKVRPVVALKVCSGGSLSSLNGIKVGSIRSSSGGSQRCRKMGERWRKRAASQSIRNVCNCGM